MDDFDRNERRERDKLARQQVLNSDTEKQPLFSAPVRLSPSESDPRIASKLGDFSIVKRFINERKNLIGISTSDQRLQQSISSSSQAPPPQSQQQQQPPPSLLPPVPSSSSGGGSSSGQVPSNNRNPPPPHHYHQPHPPPPRNTFIKQIENKPSYNGRGGYPGQSVKHEIHSSGIAPGKGPPPPSSSAAQQLQLPLAPPPSQSSMMPNGRANDKMLGPPMIPNGRFQVPLPKPPKFPQENADISSGGLPLPINGDVENIIKEMTLTASYTPLTEIAATPRKEMDSKFTFGQPNPHKYAELPPPLKAALSSRVEREKSVPKQTTELENDLDLSESDDERKKQTSTEHLSPINDASSESSESASSESGSEESNGPKGEPIINQTSKWTLSKFFKTPVQNENTPHQSMPDNNSSHSNEPIIKHEPVTPIDDAVLSSSPVTPYRNVNSNNSNSNQLPILLSDVKKESAILVNDTKKDSSIDLNQYQINKKTNSISNNGHIVEISTPVQIKNETFDKSPSSSPEKVQHSDTIESDQIESVLAEAKELAEIKPVSEIGTSSGEEEKKKVKRKKSPSKRPVKRIRKTAKDKKVGSDSSDEDEEFSSANTLSSRRSRSKSIDQEKKGRGRPRKNLTVNSSTTGSTVLKVTTPNKKDVTKKVTARRRMSQHTNVKSRETLDTTDSSSDDDKLPPKQHTTDVLSQSKMSQSPKTNATSNRTLCQIQKGPTTGTRNVFNGAAQNRNDDDDDDDDDDDGFQSSSPTGEDRLSFPPENSRQQYSPAGHRSSVRSKLSSSSSSSDDHSDSDSDDLREDKKIRDKTKSDKNKSDTLRKLFLGLNKGEGGAKGKGQVLIVDQSEESLNQGKETSTHHEKLLSPISAFKHNNSANTNTASDVTHSNHNAIRSPRTPITNNNNNHMRTPERSSVSLNKHQPVTPNSSNSSGNISTSSTSNRGSYSSLVCKIELSRLLHVPPEWYQNTYVLQGRSPAALSSLSGPDVINPIGNRSGRTSVQSITGDDDIVRSPALRIKSHRISDNINNSRDNFSSIESASGSGVINNNNTKTMTPPTAISSSATNSNIVNTNNSRLAHDMASTTTATTTASSAPSGVGNILPSSHNRSGVLISGSINSNSSSNNSSNSNILNNSHNVLINRDHDAISSSMDQSGKSMNYGGYNCVNNRNIDTQQRIAGMCVTSNSNNSTNLIHSPKMEDRAMLANQASLKSGIKREIIKSECMDDYGNYKPPIAGNLLGQSDDKYNLYNSKLSNNNTVKQEQLIKNEYGIASHNNPALISNDLNDNPKQPHNMVTINNNSKLIGNDDIAKNRRKRSSSPFKEKRRKKNEGMEQLPPTNHDRLPEKVILPPPQPPVSDVYRTNDIDIFKDGEMLWDHTKYLEEAKRFKHAADKESDHFDQVKLYLRAAIYFLISSAALEEEKRTDSAFSLYKETLKLIKHICSKIGPTQSMQGGGNHNKIVILSLRCQSIISCKLYKMRRYESKEAQRIANDFFNKGNELPNGNTPSISPTNSVCSRGSGSTTPPMHMVPVQVYTALDKQTLYFNYLAGCHDLWDKADNLVRTDNHADFFISLDQEHGPLTLHSSIYDVFRYVQAGLQKLKDL